MSPPEPGGPSRDGIYRVAGPPGTGKTRWVSRQCELAAEKYGPAGVVVCSVTKAAAREAAGRVSPSIRVGTLHSICYGMLGRPTIAAKDDIAAWNELHPTSALSGETLGERVDLSRSMDYGRATATDRGDELHGRASLYLHGDVPAAAWSHRVLEFHRAWTAFKRDRGVIDFDDMIVLARESLPLPPEYSRVILVDEAQDLSRLETSLLARWANHLDRVVFVGDQDQALYGWRGAAREAMAGPYFTTLHRSWRVPRAVHAVARAITGAVEDRTECDYEPHEGEGSVERANVPLVRLDPVLADVEAEIEAGSTVMLIASCGYMLRPALAALRERAIPYHNPYSGRWSPLRLNRGGSARVVVDYLAACDREAYTVGELRSVANALRSTGVFKRGGKKRISELPDEASIGDVLRLMKEIVEPQAVGPIAFEPDLGWLIDRTHPARRTAIEFAARVHQRWGRIQPRLVVGTIHSVKGGEADVVIVAPDLSMAGAHQTRQPGWQGRDATHRLFYVAATRARRRLVLLQPSTPQLSYRWPM